MQRVVPLHELDAREVLPVPHGLLEQGLVGAAEVAINLVRDHAILPNTFFAVRRCPDGAVAGTGLNVNKFTYIIILLIM